MIKAKVKKKAKVNWLNPPIKSQLSDQSIVIKWYLQQTALKQR